MAQNFARPVIGAEEANALIRQKLTSNLPFLAGRMGSTELQVASSFLFQGTWTDQTRYFASNNTGINPITDQNLLNFSIHFLDCVREMDIMATWDVQHYDNITNLFAAKAELIPLRGIEPYYYPTVPWSEMLAGKRVLVVHPFEDSIKKQYARKNELFRGTNILPDFQLLTIKAEQTLGAVNTDYFECLKIMQDKVYNTEFDVAIVGCGGYGLALGAFIKSAKRRTCIHMGGAVQILFGIMGNRWLENEEIMAFHNPSWTRPTQAETPANSKAVENACYW